MSKNQIKLGSPLFKNYDNPEEWVAILKQLNYQAAYCPVEIDTNGTLVEDYKKVAEANNIVISEVGAWSNTLSVNDEERQKAIEKNIKSLYLAEQINANCCVNISGTRHPKKWAAPHKDNLTQNTFDLIVETTREIIDAVKPKRTYFTLEAMPWAYPDSPDSYLDLIKAVDRKQLAVHLDPVNMITNPHSYFSNELFIKDCFRKLGSYIKSCHAKDILINEETDLLQFIECAPGQGFLNYKTYLNELSKLKDVPLMLEHLNTAKDYLEAANHIREIGHLTNINVS